MPSRDYYTKDELRKQRDDARDRLDALEKDQQHIIDWLEEIAHDVRTDGLLNIRKQLLTLILYIENL